MTGTEGHLGSTDVVIVGGGVGGASLAYALASAGVGVTLLEGTVEYEDRVRGESMHAWGVAEARELGVEDVLLAAGAHVAPVWKQYAEGLGQTGEIPMSAMVPGVEGTLNLHHPTACQALVDAAVEAGARAVRGTRDVKLRFGDPISVSYRTPRGEGALTSPLVVGADGRNSTVRRQVGLTLDRQPAVSHIAGLLVGGLGDVPDDHDVMVTIAGSNLLLLVFHQGGGRARTYLATGVEGRSRFAGREGTRRFLEACAVSCLPWSDRLVAAEPAGPCATYPGDDTWTEAPYADGVVLIGDAAGHNDPIVGQGLSIAMRDARAVRDLVLDGAHRADDFSAYGAERVERMRRVRLIADIVAAATVEDAANRGARLGFFGEKMAAMDPELFPLMMGLFAGPETIPAELVDDRILVQIRNA